MIMYFHAAIQETVRKWLKTNEGLAILYHIYAVVV